MTLHLLLERLCGAVEAASDVLSDLVDSQDPRLLVLKIELEGAKTALESLRIEDQESGGTERRCPSRPSLEQAKAMADMVGVTEEDAEAWWFAREATDWMRGTAGGGLIPVGKNHAADLKTFTNSLKSSSLRNGSPTNGHARPKAETVWSLKQSLEAVHAELDEIESSKVGAWGELSKVKKERKAKLLERKRELGRKLSGLGE